MSSGVAGLQIGLIWLSNLGCLKVTLMISIYKTKKKERRRIFKKWALGPTLLHDMVIECERKSITALLYQNSMIVLTKENKWKSC